MAKGKYHEWLTEDSLKLIKGWVRDGLTNDEVAEKMHIRPQTLYEWMNRFPDIAEAFKKSKEIYDNEVVDSLWKSTKGYFVEEETTDIWEDADGNRRKHIVKKKRWIPPDTTAQIYWLNNRARSRWKARQPDDNNIPTEGVTVIIDV